MNKTKWNVSSWIPLPSDAIKYQSISLLLNAMFTFALISCIHPPSPLPPSLNHREQKKKSHSIHIHTKKNRKENLSKSFFFCAKYIAEFQIMEFFMMAKKIQYFFSLALHSLRPPRYSHEAYVIQQIASWGFAAYVMINNWTFFDGLQRANKPTNKIFSFFCFLSESCYCFFLIKMCACWCVSVFCHRLITA